MEVEGVAFGVCLILVSYRRVSSMVKSKSINVSVSVYYFTKKRRTRGEVLGRRVEGNGAQHSTSTT